MIKFQNPDNGYIETSRCPWLWTLLFNWIYFAYKGAWAWALIALVMAVPTLFISNLVLPFFARGIIFKNYQRKGWINRTKEASQ